MQSTKLEHDMRPTDDGQSYISEETSDPVFARADEYWFMCEHWMDEHGPFGSEKEARDAHIAYAKTL